MTGIILAGGRNTRIGTDKAFLEINGVRLIDRTIAIFQGIFEEIIVVTNSPLSYLDQNVTIVTDVLENKGPLGGLYTGLFFTFSQYAFACACDMPFLDGSFIKYMIEHCTDSKDIVVPYSGDGLQPLHAIYSKKCLPAMLNHLKRDKLKIIDLYKGLKILTIKEDVIETFDKGRKMFLNINSHADLRHILSA